MADRSPHSLKANNKKAGGGAKSCTAHFLLTEKFYEGWLI
jgi:hypothetical protein